MDTKLSVSSKIFLMIASACLIISTFVPIWKIDLDAPQYPEGLGLKIFANKISGDVDIINGLNHYIGMKTLHTEDFFEFTVLPYIIFAFATLCVITVFINRKKMLYILLGLFVAFGILAMIDFWRWEYDYGHDLAPNAAIIVPGMAYQPPLIGFKQLLNFGAYSIPDIGGWLFILSGLLMVFATLVETGFINKLFKKNNPALIAASFAITLLSSCANNEAQPINYNKDNCDNCKMTIVDNRFASEIITSKGKAFRFDDISCMIEYNNDNKEKMGGANYFVTDFYTHTLLNVKSLTFIEGEEVASPMGGNIASFSNKDSSVNYAKNIKGTITQWASILK